MINLLRSELYKLKRFLPFYVITGLTAVFFIYAAYRISMGDYYSSTHHAFADSLSDTSLSFMFAIMTAWFVGYDLSTRTINRELTTGTNRLHAVIVRAVPVWIMNIIFHLVCVITNTVGIVIFRKFPAAGFGISDIAWTATVMLQVMALATVITLITFICGKMHYAIVVSVLVLFVLCNILRNFTDAEIYRCSCFCFASDSSCALLIKCSVCAVFTIIAGIGAAYLVFGKRDMA